jgi:hypothetical protein
MAAPGRHAWPAALAAGTTRTGSEAISEQNLAYLTALAARGLNSQPGAPAEAADTIAETVATRIHANEEVRASLINAARKAASAEPQPG